MTKLGNPPNVDISSPEWAAWKAEVANWYATVWDEWGSSPWLTRTEQSVPSVRRPGMEET